MRRIIMSVTLTAALVGLTACSRISKPVESSSKPIKGLSAAAGRASAAPQSSPTPAQSPSQQAQDAIKKEEDKSVSTRAMEGIDKGMQRAEPGSSGAALGEAVKTVYDVYEKNKKPEPARSKPSRATKQ